MRVAEDLASLKDKPSSSVARLAVQSRVPSIVLAAAQALATGGLEHAWRHAAFKAWFLYKADASKLRADGIAEAMSAFECMIQAMDAYAFARTYTRAAKIEFAMRALYGAHNAGKIALAFLAWELAEAGMEQEMKDKLDDVLMGR